MIYWTSRALRPCLTVLVQFFWGEAAYGTSIMLKTIYCSRLLLLCVPCVAALLVIGSIITWPMQKETGEERLVLQGEFRAERERNREVQYDLKSDVALSRSQIHDLQVRQAKTEEFQHRIEEKFDIGMKILWTICSLLIAQVIIPLLKLGLRRELAKIKVAGEDAL